MSLCCHCTSSGQCGNCICVRSGCPYFNCLPIHKGMCEKQELSEPDNNSISNHDMNEGLLDALDDGNAFTDTNSDVPIK